MAVYTPLSQKDIETFLREFDAGKLQSFKGIAEGVENTNYLLLTGEGEEETRYILTIYEKRVNPADLPFFLGLTEWLAERGIVCPRPIAGKDGKVIRSLRDKPAALIQFLHGRGNPHITPRHMELVGDLVARMHLAAEGYTGMRRNALGLDGWDHLFTRIRSKLDSIAEGLERDISEELSFLRHHWPHGLPSGIVHTDLFPDNLFFLDGNTDQPELSGVIDFYFACHDAWAYDLLICMNAWCFDTGHHFMPERAKALMSRYTKRRPLTDAERKAMPVLARGAALRFLLTRAYDWLHPAAGALVNPKDPMEYVAKLRFHREHSMTRLLDDWMTQ